MTKNKIKYLLFDAMLAVHELIWSAQRPPLDLPLLKLDKDLRQLYVFLDSLQILVYDNNNEKDGNIQAINFFETHIEPLLKSCQELLLTRPDHFKQNSVALSQLANVWTLKTHFSREI